MNISARKGSLHLRDKIIRLLLLVATVSIVVYFMPREGKFRYHFQEGKPWKYGLLTAPFDFPIYKTDLQIHSEKDSILDEFHPYYRINMEMGAKQLDKLQRDYRDKLHENLTGETYNYLTKALEAMYAQGITTSTDLGKLEKEKITSIRVLQQNISKLRDVKSFPTVREAYQKIIAGSHSEAQRKALQNSNISNYLEPNLTFDKITTDKVRSELLQNLSIYSGLVQTGERIVDRGDIITPGTFNILRSLEIADNERAGTSREQYLTVIGQASLVLILIGSILLFLYLFRFEMYSRTRDIILIMIMVTIMVVACSVLGHFRILSIYMVPLAMVPIVIRTFLDSRVAFFTHIVMALLCSFLAPFNFEFLLLQIAVGITSIFSLKELTQRSQLAKVAAFIFITYAVTYSGYTLIMEGSWDKLNPTMYFFFLINSVALLFTYLFIFLLEKTLGFTSNVTLVELSNINSPLLRRLSEECPGTFQHSIQISNLCALAARKIGANVQLVRTAALYHDVGKLTNPSFFTENQQGANPHNTLTTEQSVAIIKQHVFDGIKLAQREKLPEEVIAFIATHHGAGKIKYFYNRWKNEHPDEYIDESIFQYPGPNPYTKEQALLMITDGVEAASRSLKEYTEEACSKLINQIIDTLMKEGMLSNTPLSFRDLEMIKQVYIERILSMYHTRVSYPELKQRGK